MGNDLQPSLFNLEPLRHPEYEDGMTLREKWWAFHCANLHVYATLRAMAFELKERGFQKASIALLWERLRWESYIRTQGEGEYKLSNNHRAFYSRFLMAREPELQGFFMLKKQTSECGEYEFPSAENE